MAENAGRQGEDKAGMIKTKRDYTTWEEDFTSDRCELHGYNDELVAVIDSFRRVRAAIEWSVKDKDGKMIALKKTKEQAMKAAEGLL